MDNTLAQKIPSKIEVGDFEVINSGSVLLSDKKNPLIFYIDDIVLEFVFLEKDVNKKCFFEFAEKNAKHIIVKCINFNSSLGGGFKDIVEICEVDRTNIYMSFLAIGVGSTPYIIYSFYKRK